MQQWRDLALDIGAQARRLGHACAVDVEQRPIAPRHLGKHGFAFAIGRHLAQQEHALAARLLERPQAEHAILGQVDNAGRRPSAFGKAVGGKVLGRRHPITGAALLAARPQADATKASGAIKKRRFRAINCLLTADGLSISAAHCAADRPRLT